MILKEINNPDKMLLVHNGALGDFFMTWPSILALRTAHPTTELLWAGKPAMHRWLEKLGVTRAEPKHLRGLRALYGAEDYPPELTETRVIWFGLSAPCPCRHEEIFFLPGIDGQHPDTAPRELYLAGLQACGIPRVPDWHSRFQNLFTRPPHQPKKQVFLFPGSGHPAKNWSMVKFLELAARLADAGESPCFILGPVERERKMNCSPFPSLQPESLDELETLLASARLVIGNDSGPLHLAGCLGTPGLGLFGPTNHLQWGAPGITALFADTPCRPCSATARITCTQPICMDIPVKTVFKECLALLNRSAPDARIEEKDIMVVDTK